MASTSLSFCVRSSACSKASAAREPDSITGAAPSCVVVLNMIQLFVNNRSNADSVANAVAPSPAVPAPVGKVRPLHITGFGARCALDHDALRLRTLGVCGRAPFGCMFGTHVVCVDCGSPARWRRRDREFECRRRYVKFLIAARRARRLHPARQLNTAVRDRAHSRGIRNVYWMFKPLETMSKGLVAAYGRDR